MLFTKYSLLTNGDNMKMLILFIFFSCAYDDLCPRDVQLIQLDRQMKLEYSKLKNIDPVNDLDIYLEQQYVIESLEIEKIILQNQPCK